MKRASPWTQLAQVRPCPLCAGERHTFVSARMQHGLDLTTVVCEQCSFVFTNPLPSRQTYERFYRDAYAEFYGHITPTPEGARLQIEPAPLTKRFGRLERVMPLAGCRLLEVGPGNGLFLWWARQRGGNVLGVEPSPEFCEVLASAGIPHIQATLAEIQPQTHGQFDLIFMSHVLEHFYDPNEALEHCRALLTDGGVLTVDVPNILKPFRSLDRYFLRYVHPSSFSPATLMAILEKHGFSPVAVDEGGEDWRSPQNLFVISRKGDGRARPRNKLAGRSREVLAALEHYRRRWRWNLAWRWRARSLSLALRRAARSWKQRLLNQPAETLHRA